MQILISLIVVCVCAQVESFDSSTKIVSVERSTAKNGFKIVDGRIAENWVAWATFSDQTYDNGWSFLKVVTNVNFPDQDQAYAAGLAEGVLTCKKMHDFWESYLSLTCDPSTGSSVDLCDQTWKFLQENKKWMETQINNSSVLQLTNYTMFKTLQFIAYGGPTHDQQPPFRWSTYDSQGLIIKHPGQPDLWNFSPIVTTWN